MNILQKSKQKIEQDLTDVHNYQESERGKRFQEMEVKPLSLMKTKFHFHHHLIEPRLVIDPLDIPFFTYLYVKIGHVQNWKSIKKPMIYVKWKLWLKHFVKNVKKEKEVVQVHHVVSPM
jgi:uncharacterized membrane protein (DUF106 family)